jgi:hypothetical protein
VRKLFTLFFAAIILILSCCTTSPKEPYYPHNIPKRTIIAYIDKNFQPNEVADIEHALMSWQCSLSELVSFIIVENAKYEDFDTVLDPTNSLFFWVANSTDERLVEIDKQINSTDGIERHCVGLYIAGYDWYPNTILIATDRLNHDIRETVLHECGHALLGYAHSTNPNSIMYPYLDKGAHQITSDDIQRYCQKHHCYNQKLKPCDI